MSHNPPSPGAGEPVPFAQHRVVDELHGVVVSAFEHPQDWPAHSQVVWNFEDTAYPVAIYASTFNPRGSEAVEFLPTEACFWIGHSLMHATGQKYRGSTCLPPMSGTDTLLRFLIPKYRGDRQDLRVLFAQPVPNLAALFGMESLLGQRHEGVMARVEYAERGRVFEEEFYACVMWHPPNGGQLNWGALGPRCFRAERGRLDEARPLLWHLITSVRGNPQWGPVFEQVVRQLQAQTQAFQAAVRAKLDAEVDFGRKLREYNDWQFRQSQQQFDEWWAADERRSRQAGDLLTGVQRYVDPGSASGNYHLDHGHHRYAWTNNRQRWIHTNDPNYNPNQDPAEMGDGHWYLQQPV